MHSEIAHQIDLFYPKQNACHRLVVWTNARKLKTILAPRFFHRIPEGTSKNLLNRL